MGYPIYDFSDPLLNYSLVETTVDQMYSDIIHRGEPCCKSKSLTEKLCEIDIILSSIEIDRPDNLRYKEDVKAAYLLLYPLA